MGHPYSEMAMANGVITGYFNGVMHFINGVFLLYTYKCYNLGHIHVAKSEAKILV